jgi:aquaporin Z
MQSINAKYYMEFIGTFFLMCAIIFTGGLGVMQPVAIGLSLIALINIGLPISGAHYNPATSLAIFMQKKMSKRELGLYVLFQMGGAITASLFYLLIQQEFDAVWQLTLQKTIVGELIGTIGLITIIMLIAHPKFKHAKMYIGVTIGLGLIGLIYAFAPLSGAIFNPAIAIGFAVAGNISLELLPVYIVTSLVASSLVNSVIKWS